MILPLCSWLQLKYPSLVKSMRECSHHYDENTLNPYHLEGDVWTHTCMVAKQAEKYDVEVQIAAWLHDIGKPTVAHINSTKMRTTFIGHEAVSSFLAVDIIDSIAMDFNLQVNKRHILEMIALHLDPYRLTIEQLSSKLIENKELMSKLMNLADADHNGRFGMGERITQKILFPEVAVSINATKELIILIGLPCSGKSSFVESLTVPYKIVSRDDLVMQSEGISYNEKWENSKHKNIDSSLMKQFTNLVKNDENILIDMTNLSRKTRKKWLHSIPQHYKKTALVFFPPLYEIINRNHRRGNENGKFIAPEIYKRMMESFCPPMYDEFNEINWIF